ncbi:hypothetical protein KA047_01585 [Candidatus Saccharibacteria bacterium]|nr:hypothetical protein [Candidatus Saccharibacteria bacterium]
MLKRFFYTIGIIAVVLSFAPASVFAVPLTRVRFTPATVSLNEGETTTVEVRLDEPIISEDPEEAFVSIALAASTPGAVTFDASPVVFDDTEWAQVKTFDITAAENDVENEDAVLTVTGTASGGSEYYNGFVNTMQVTILDNDAPEDDLNGDNIPDNTQSNIGGYVSSITGKTVAMDVGEDCELTTDDMTEEVNLTAQDSDYTYANGLFDIAGDCGTPGFTTTIKLYYYDVDSDGLVFRKYNPASQAYTTVTDAAITETTIYGQAVTVVTYDLTDGGELDTDGLVNGEFEDPAGLASQIEQETAATLADTGSPMVVPAIAALVLLASAVLSIILHPKRSLD